MRHHAAFLILAALAVVFVSAHSTRDSPTSPPWSSVDGVQAGVVDVARWARLTQGWPVTSAAFAGNDEARRARMEKALDAARQVADDGRSGTLRMLSYNIAGLPHFVSKSRPVLNIPHISRLINRYALVLVQEDFSYHGELARHALHPHRSEPKRFTGTLMSDGLNRFSSLPFQELRRERWTSCHGLLSHANDCLAEKGFSVARTYLAEDTTVDVYNVHADAGGGVEDAKARAEGFDQLTRFIRKHSKGQAVIVAGDTNLKPEVSRIDRRTLRRFSKATGLKDACESLRCTQPSIDRVLVRSRPGLELEPRSIRFDRQFVDAEGEDLSDHLALALELHWRRLD